MEMESEYISAVNSEIIYFSTALKFIILDECRLPNSKVHIQYIGL